MSADIEERQWATLLDSIEQGECIPVLGPNLPAVLEDGSTGNLAIELSRELAGWLSEGDAPNGVHDSTNLCQVAQLIEKVHSRDELTSGVKRFYEKHAKSLGDREDPTFQHLGALPFPLFLTSRHDDTLQWYLKKQGKQPELELYHFHGDHINTLGNLGTTQQPVIYHFYGRTDKPDSMVLTENDTLDFLQFMVKSEPGLPKDLLNLFQNKNFLFLGFGLGDYQLRVLLHVLNLNKDKMSLALENTPLAEKQTRFKEKFGDSVLFYNHLGYKLKLLDSNLNEFVEELHHRWIERHPKGSADAEIFGLDARDTIDTDLAEKPSVFISYVKEDENRAQRLFEDLRAAGINPWLDTDALRSGMHWDQKLEEAVNTVDYFIVLQSKALSNRKESFVHKEIKIALQRADLKPPETPFIFPVQLDKDAEPLKALKKIQTDTLFDWQADVNKLARTIIRDSQLQNRNG